MNFSKDETNKKIKALKTRSKRLSTKLNVTIFRLFLLSIVFLGAVGVAALAGIVNGLSATVPSIDLIHVVPSGYASNTYYRDGTHAETLAGVEANRDYVSIIELPKHIKYAFVAMEDERFYEHNGIDMRGIMRALVSNLNTKSLDYGASTITQQLLKNQVFGGGNEKNPFVKLSRKIQEQFLAVEGFIVHGTQDDVVPFGGGFCAGAVHAGCGGHVQACGGMDVILVVYPDEGAFVRSLEFRAGCAVSFVADDEVEVG